MVTTQKKDRLLNIADTNTTGSLALGKEIICPTLQVSLTCKSQNKYIVFNIIEKKNCHNKPEEKKS
jgi:hypothetical protein